MHARGVALAVVVGALLSIACGGEQGSPGGAYAVEARAGADLALAVHPGPRCGQGVKVDGGSLFVAPSGADDTANLQCAIDAAIASRHATTIILGAGTFHTSQLVAKGFVGVLRGAGQNATILTNLDQPLFVTPVDMYLQGVPSASNPWPTLIAFLGGAFSVSDLSIQIRGVDVTQGWSIYGIPSIKGLAHAVAILGTSAKASFVRVAVEGEPSPGDFYGVNVGNGIVFEGALDTGATIAGRFEVRDSLFTSLVSPVPFLDTRGASAIILGNTFQNTHLGAEVSDIEDGSYAFLFNTISLSPIVADFPNSGVIVYDYCQNPPLSACGTKHMSLVLGLNRITTPGDGIDLFTAFGDDVACSIFDNRITTDPASGGVGVYLGPGTSGCKVVRSGAVVDDGTGNHVY